MRGIPSIALALALTAATAWGQEDPIPAGIRAGQEAYELHEGQRRAAAGAQLELNQILRNRLPWPSPYGETVYYAPGYFSGGVYSPRGYGLTMHQPYGYSPQSYLGATAAFGPGTYLPYPSLFAYDYPPPAIRQEIGRRQVQTGPRRWESYPIYGDEPSVGERYADEPFTDDSAPEPRRSVPRAVERVREESPPLPLEPAPREPKPRRGPREF